MKHLNTACRCLCLYAVLAATLVGCATPRDRYIAADRALLAAQQAATAAIAAGYFDDKPDALRAVKFGLNEANAASAKAKTLVLAGDDPSLDFWIDRILDGLNRANAELRKGK